MIPIKIVRLDFQKSKFLDEEKVWELAQAIERGDAIPPITIRFDGEHYWLQDGFHRLAAASSLGRDQIDAEILPGTLADMKREYKEMLRAQRGRW
jgi:ParB-like chromosome segregation protein Spo0J